MKKLIAASSLLSVLLLAACSSIAQSTPSTVATAASPVVPTHTVTRSSTSTPLSSTAMSITSPVSTPEGQPASEWNGIPIMPGATAGEGDEEGYVFAIKATPEQIKEYYQIELGKLGWQSLETGNQDPVQLRFVNNTSATLTVNIMTKREEALVLLVK